MPYAYGAKIRHEYLIDTDLLNVWLTFRHPMDQDVKPPLIKWLLEADAIAYDIVDSAWQDEFTLLLTSDTIAAHPARVTLEYAGPDPDLQTTWGKDWEPWGPTLSVDLTATLWVTGMIIKWPFSIESIPSGWHLCDGTEGTPDLRNKFTVGAGSTYAPGDSGGASIHAHTQTSHFHSGILLPGGDISSGTGYTSLFTSDGKAPAIQDANHLPPWGAVCYIMKL